jgi:hypothetical protein
MRRDPMRGWLLAAIVVVGWLAVPAAAAAQPYSEDAAFGTLYTSFGLLQALDAHSTSRALASGATESNALLAGIAHRPVLLMGAKTAVTAGTIVLMERFRRRHPRAAMVTLMVLNSAYAVVVVRNSRIAHQRNVR